MIIQTRTLQELIKEGWEDCGLLGLKDPYQRCHPELRNLLDQVLYVVECNQFLGLEYISGVYHKTVYIPPDAYKTVQVHVCKFPDTALLKSWCSCGKEGIYNRKECKYE